MWQYVVQFHGRFIGPSTLRMGPADLLKLGRYWTSTWKEFGEKWRSLSRKISLGTLAFPISVLRSSISYWALPKQLPLCVRWWHYTNIYIYTELDWYIYYKKETWHDKKCFGVQMEMHPGWRNDKMLEACKKNGIHVTVRLLLIWMTYWYLLYGSAGDFVHKFLLGILTTRLIRRRQRSGPWSDGWKDSKEAEQEPRTGAGEVGHPERD